MESISLYILEADHVKITGKKKLLEKRFMLALTNKCQGKIARALLAVQ